MPRRNCTPSEEMSLEMDRRVAARLRQQPALLRLAQDNLDSAIALAHAVTPMAR